MPARRSCGPIHILSGKKSLIWVPVYWRLRQAIPVELGGGRLADLKCQIAVCRNWRSDGAERWRRYRLLSRNNLFCLQNSNVHPPTGPRPCGLFPMPFGNRGRRTTSLFLARQIEPVLLDHMRIPREYHCLPFAEFGAFSALNQFNKLRVMRRHHENI